MSKTVSLNAAVIESDEEIATARAELEKYSIEWEQIRQRMESRHANIETLKAETRAMLSQMASMRGK